MAFCPNCGAEVQGRFCAKCGSAVAAAPTGGATAPPPPPGPMPGATVSSGPVPGATPYAAGPSTGGLADNMAAALCYVPVLITGIIFLLLSPYNQNKFIRFHAFQSIFFGVAWIGLSIALNIFFLILHSVVSLLVLPVYPLIWLAGFIIWIVLVVKAYNGERFKLPIIGDLAEKQA